MDDLIPIIFFCSLSFIFYAILALTSKDTKKEFKRWKFEEYRVFIAVFQLIGGFGLLVGITYNSILLISSFGLSIMMFLALYVRIKIKDTFIQYLPALIFLIANLFIFINSF
jgi:hypothetical protein